MIDTPLVTVLLPCYNSAHSLPMALASLVAQTYERWECIVVDDGSIDDPDCVVRAFADDRIQFVRHGSNLGRAAARQTALELASGDYITFVDADDWLYPEKLSRQMEAMSAYQELAVVSSSMAILDGAGRLRGVSHTSGKRRRPVEPSVMSHLARPPFSYVAAMVRRSYIPDTAYCRHLRRAEDLDFFIRATLGNSFTLQPEALYAYTGWNQFNLQTHIETLRQESTIFLSHWRRDPMRSILYASLAAGKSRVYRAAHTLNCDHTIMNRRCYPATPVQQTAYLEARHQVQLLVDQIFT